MITKWIFDFLYNFIVGFLGDILPNANSALLTKFQTSFDWLINTFTGVGYYWLPINDFAIALTFIVSVYILSLTTKLIMKMIHIFSGGFIKTDKL